MGDYDQQFYLLPHYAVRFQVKVSQVDLPTNVSIRHGSVGMPNQSFVSIIVAPEVLIL